jgi:hypothetical protein
VNEFLHPEWVDGRRIWMDGPMHDLIHRIRYGDPVKGWDGDQRLALYFNGETERFELWRLEDDEQYRLVCRSGVGIPLDERIIDALIGMDGRRRQTNLATEVREHNDALEASRAHQRDEWIHEDLAPRLRHAWMKEL